MGDAVIEAALATEFGASRGTVYVAFSGGVDSTTLLHAAIGRFRASREGRPSGGRARLIAVHVNHGLMPESDGWQRHCAAVASGFGAPLLAIRVSVARGGNLEAEARRARYGAWRQLLGPADVLLLGHQATDQAETRLWQLFTGRFPGGMPAQRRLGQGRLWRPLLGVQRVDIERYAQRHGLTWLEDPSNADLRLDRNYIRHCLLPRVERRHRGATRRLAAPRPAPLASGVAPLPAAADARATEAWLLAAGLPVRERTVAELGRQGGAAADRSPCVKLAPGVEARRHQGAWHLLRSSAWVPDLPRPPTVRVGAPARLAAGRLSWQPRASGLAPGVAFEVRPRRGGERIRDAARGVSKTVKALFQEAGVPVWQRRHWPLLYDAAGCLAAVPGLAVDERAAVAGGLRAEYLPHRAAAPASAGPD